MTKNNGTSTKPPLVASATTSTAVPTVAWQPTVSLEMLTARSVLLSKLRKFFSERHFIEVETPLVSTEIIPEEHIEPFQTEFLASENNTLSKKNWLQASPECAMKRLLALGAGPIYQITRSFRRDERGKNHNPEFTIVEWYRPGDNMAAGIDLLDQMIQFLLEAPPAKKISYQEAFAKHLGIDPHRATLAELMTTCQQREVQVPAGLKPNREEWLELLFVTYVEPNLGQTTPEILYHYPASQAALAKIRLPKNKNETAVAERFELYWQGLELANGYHELTDSSELRTRLEQVNRSRKNEGRPALPMPTRLLAAMQHGLPACSGVAMGLDRCLMLATGKKKIEEVLFLD